MSVEDILKGFQSDSMPTILEKLNIILLNDSYAQDKSIFSQLIILLDHEQYIIRNEVDITFQHFFKHNPECEIILYPLLIQKLETIDLNQNLRYRCLKLYSLLKMDSERLSKLINIIRFDGYAQGMTIFMLKSLIKTSTDVTTIVKDMLSLLSSLEVSTTQNEEDYEFTERKISNMKKNICWFFLKNQEAFSSQLLDLLTTLKDDSDREVRRLSCEILVEMLNFADYRETSLTLLESKVNDNSWRVQKSAIFSLLSYSIKNETIGSEYSDKILGLFWDTSWQVRKNICENLPSLISLQEERNMIILEILIAALDDFHWEVRERAAISLNRFLDLRLRKNYDILFKLTKLCQDPHAEVRRTSMNIILDHFTSFYEEDNIFIAINRLLQDSNWIVRYETCKKMFTILHLLKPEKLREIVEIFWQRLDDEIDLIREITWKNLDVVTSQLSKSALEEFVKSIVTHFKSKNPKTRLLACNYLKEQLFLWEGKSKKFNPKGFVEGIIKLTYDEATSVRLCTWEVALNNPDIFRSVIQEISSYLESIENAPLEIKQFFYKNYNRYSYLKKHDTLKNQMMSVLTNPLKNVTSKKQILKSCFPQHRNLVTPQAMSIIVSDGHWKNQQVLIPFLISFLINNKKSSSVNIIYNNVLDLLNNPVSRFKALESNQKRAKSIELLLNTLEEELTEERLKIIFKIENDDQRFQWWIKLEEQFDFLLKLQHPKNAEIEERFKEILTSQLKFNYLIFEDFHIDSGDFGFRTPKLFIDSLIRQQELVRWTILEEIEFSVNFDDPFFDKLRKVVLNLLDDPSLKIRSKAWSIIKQRILYENSDPEIDSSIVKYLDNIFPDTRVHTIFCLMSHNHLFEPRNEAILFKILGMIDDPSDLIRLTVWRLIESKINLSYKRYLPLVNKIIVLATDKNPQKRKEAIHFIKTHLNIFNPIIEAYPQPTKVKHIFGTIYSENGDLERALPFFNKIVKADPSELDSWLAIALSHLQYGDPNQAIQTLDMAKKVNRFDFRIHEIYAECLSELQQEASAEKFRDIAKILKARESISINRDKWD